MPDKRGIVQKSLEKYLIPPHTCWEVVRPAGCRLAIIVFRHKSVRHPLYRRARQAEAADE